MRARTALALVAGLGLLFGGAIVLVVQLTDPGEGTGGSDPAPTPPEPAPPPPGPLPPGDLTPPELSDPVEARRLELHLEARSRYRSLRDGFKGPASEPSRQRLEPALRSLWPQAPYTVACRGRVCRVEGPGAAAEWQPALQAHPPVVAVADQVVVDPDGLERPAYVLVTPGRPGSGDDFLGGFERSFREAVEDEGCPEGAGTVEYQLQVDESGITYRAGGTAPQEVIDCVGRVLAEQVTATRVPPSTKAATRTVTLGGAR